MPVFADVEPELLTLYPQAVERAITPRTAAILPVHFLGVPSDVTALAGIAARHGLWLVHDAAHAFGVTLNGRPIGHFGDAAAFSRHATKLLNTAEGGFIVTRAAGSRDLRRMRNVSIEQGRAVGPGLNGKMSELHAEIAARQALRQRSDAALDGLPGLRLHGTRPGASPALCVYALRARLHLALAEAGIFARDHFPLLCGPGTAWADSRIVTARPGPAITPRVGP